MHTSVRCDCRKHRATLIIRRKTVFTSLLVVVLLQNHSNPKSAFTFEKNRYMLEISVN